MKFFVDTADVKEIRELNDLGLLDGVTTNPSLILKSGGKIAEVTKEICEHRRRPGLGRSHRDRIFRDDEGGQGRWPGSPTISASRCR